MFSNQIHTFTDNLGQTYAFAVWPQRDGSGTPRRQAVIRSKVYARQTLDSIVNGHQDPFHYGLMDLWLEVFQKPWAKPRDLNRLIDDLASKVATGELVVYLEDSPVWHFESQGQGDGASGFSATVHDKGVDAVRTQSPAYTPHRNVKEPRTGDRIFKREHPHGNPEDRYTLQDDGKPMGADSGIMPADFIGLEKLPPDHDNLVKEGWPTLNYKNSATYATFTDVKPVFLEEGTTIYRFVDEESVDAGGFWASEIPKNKTEWRKGCAVKDTWNDDGYYVEHTVGPAGLKCWEGPAAGQQYEQSSGKSYYLAGGTSQLFITPNSVAPTRPKLTNWPEA